MKPLTNRQRTYLLAISIIALAEAFVGWQIDSSYIYGMGLVVATVCLAAVTKDYMSKRKRDHDERALAK
jgi:hypothetical protein